MDAEQIAECGEASIVIVTERPCGRRRIQPRRRRHFPAGLQSGKGGALAHGGEHHVVQAKGRFEVFQDYHLRVGDVTADTDPPKDAPVHERRFDETATGNAKFATFTRSYRSGGRRSPNRPICCRRISGST